ncbi:hypothetical protein ACH474_28695 [Nocardia rhamnosiphila]|uniref:hypothetical protein n=1 Tax=Nocardia rhamnosiphila TaxID=426716 RepID=UPI00068FF0E8|nr:MULTISPECIES: hypothetical protein [Nocardia]MCX0270802.1 hypothetical protein [Nocardia zapadnayensis]
MQIARSTAALSLVSVALGALVTGLGAGTAAAAEPVVDPDNARAGFRLNQPETAALAAGPIPALVDHVIPPSQIGAGLDSDTRLYRDENGGVHASLRQVILESADNGGSVLVFFHVPGAPHGRVFDIYQQWR